MKISNNLKISVHIPFFFEERKKNQVNYLKKVCRGHLNLSKKTMIYVHSNTLLKKFDKRVKFIKHSFKNIHPYKLTWLCRNLMKKQKKKFDIFIYCEDDIFFTKKNLKYWLKYKDLCISKDYNLGFLRVEKNKKDNELYSPDHIKKSRYIINQGQIKFIIPSSSHCSFWIYDKKEFNKFTKTKYFNFNWKWKTISGVLLIREMASIGWHGENMGRYRLTVIPLIKNFFNVDSFLVHLSGNYSSNPAGLFGTFKVKDLIDKKLIKFETPPLFKKILNKFTFSFYKIFRFNLKKIRISLFK
jgi:hypothetical protein